MPASFNKVRICDATTYKPNRSLRVRPVTPRFPDRLYITSLNVRSSMSPLESDAVVLCVREPCALCLNGDRPLGICRGLVIVIGRFCARVSGRWRVVVGNLSGALITQAIVNRIWISQIRQAVRTFQRALIVREEAALIERQICTTPAASQAKSVASATTQIERASSRSREIAISLKAIPSKTAASVACDIRITLPSLLLLLLQDGPNIALDSRTSSSKSTPASSGTAIALNTTGFSVGCCVFFLFLHLYDLILKGRKCASFINERTTVESNLCEILKSKHLMLNLGTDSDSNVNAISQGKIYHLEYISSRYVFHRRSR
ncbi:hypothetical protein ALC62_13177 [Cyphomyrmex costatus]|uniref:Uncharacterized protein n=1 Tax=Cyphomyrmex costatus TaxID=456900 RepID=A0A195C7I8_9HYME|nr:hypothetical protein ALC62_13177 [Cyphomyrmex costatus]